MNKELHGLELEKEYGVSQTTISKRIQEYYTKTGKVKTKIVCIRKKLPINDIIKEYEEGMTQKKLAQKYGVSVKTISSRLHGYYKEMSNEQIRITYTKELPMEEIIRKYEEGSAKSKLAREYGVSKNTISKKIQEYYIPIQEIMKKCEQGVSHLELAKEYGVSEETITQKVIEYLQKTSPKTYYFKKIKLPIDDIIKKYEKGTSQTELAKEYGVSQMTIWKRIDKYYTEIGKEKPKKIYPKKELPINDIIKKYEEGTSQTKLAREYNVSQITISLRINEYYKKTGKEKPKFKKNELLIDEIVKKYEEGIAESELAKECGTSQSIISKKIKEYYTQNGKVKPKRLRNTTTIIEYLNKGLTIEQITEIATKKNIIIPKDIIDIALSKVTNKNLTDDNEER